MTNSTYFVKSIPIRAFIGPLNTLQICYRRIEDVHKDINFVLKKIFLTNL